LHRQCVAHWLDLRGSAAGCSFRRLQHPNTQINAVEGSNERDSSSMYATQ
jgi:hypothetical protein